MPHFRATGEGRIVGKRFQIEALRRVGSEIKVELSVTARRTSAGYVFNGFIQDLTEKIAIEKQLHQAQKMEEIGNLIGGMALGEQVEITLGLGMDVWAVPALPAADQRQHGR